MQQAHNGFTPLQLAISIGDTEILELLLKSGVNPYGQTYGQTNQYFNVGAVTHVIFSKHDEEKKIEMIKLLQKYGGNGMVNDYSASANLAPIFAAIESNNVEVAAYLIREGVNTTVKTRGPKYQYWYGYQPCDAAMIFLEKPDADNLIKLYQHDESAKALLERYQKCGRRDISHCKLIERNAENERVPGKAADLLSYVVKNRQCESLRTTCSAGHSK